MLPQGVDAVGLGPYVSRKALEFRQQLQLLSLVTSQTMSFWGAESSRGKERDLYVLAPGMYLQ